MLSLLLWTLLGLAAALLAVMLLVLSTPVGLRVNIGTLPRWRVRVVTRLLGDLVPPIVLHDSEKPRHEQRQARRAKRSAERVRHFNRLRGVLVAGPRLAADLLRRVRLEHLWIDADIGLPDPADTGQFYGLLAAFHRAWPPSSTVSIVVRPDFSGPRVSGELDVAWSVVPMTLVPPGVRFAWRALRSR